MPKHSLRRRDFRKFLVDHPDGVWFTSSGSGCPLAGFLESHGARYPIVNSKQYIDENGVHKTPLWAGQFVREIDSLGSLTHNVASSPMSIMVLDLIEERMAKSNAVE